MKNFRKIDNYLKGKLTKKETALFEQEIAQNKTLEEEVNLQKLEEEALEYLVKKRLSNRINHIKENLNQEKQAAPKTKSFPLWMRFSTLAASIILAIIVFQHFNSPKPLQLFVANEYQDLPFEVSAMRKASTAPLSNNTLFIENEKKLLSDNPSIINEAITYFELISEEDTTFLVAQYDLGHAHLKLNEFKKAIPYFEYSYNQSKVYSQLKDLSQYYLLLAYLADNNLSKAQTTYNNLKANNQRFKNRQSLHNFFKSH